MLAALVIAGAVVSVGDPAALAADGMVKVGDIVIHDAWARASLGKMPNSAAYLRIENTGSESDRLVEASSERIDAVETHTHVMDNGVASMRPVDGIEVAPGGSAVLEPGGLHLMLMGVQEKLVEGGTVPVTLVFEKAGEVSLDLPIRPLQAMIKQGDDHQHDMKDGKTNHQ